MWGERSIEAPKSSVDHKGASPVNNHTGKTKEYSRETITKKVNLDGLLFFLTQ